MAVSWIDEMYVYDVDANINVLNKKKNIYILGSTNF